MKQYDFYKAMNIHFVFLVQNRDDSVGIATKLRNERSWDQIPLGARDFSSLQNVEIVKVVS
jgi:hypothetical protein